MISAFVRGENYIDLHSILKLQYENPKRTRFRETHSTQTRSNKHTASYCWLHKPWTWSPVSDQIPSLLDIETTWSKPNVNMFGNPSHKHRNQDACWHCPGEVLLWNQPQWTKPGRDLRTKAAERSKHCMKNYQLPGPPMNIYELGGHVGAPTL
jgi:hypothetical protein